MDYDDVDDDGYLFNVVIPLDHTVHGCQFLSNARVLTVRSE